MAQHESRAKRLSYGHFGILAAAVGFLFLNYGVYIGLKWTGGITSAPQTLINSVRSGLSAIPIGEPAVVSAWASFSRIYWLLRLAAVVLAVWLEKGFTVYSGLDTPNSFRAMFVAIAILIVCLSARFCGFGMFRSNETGIRPYSASLTNELQFSMREILLLMAISAILLTMMRISNEAASTPLAIVVFTAMWAFLATKHVWLRLLVLVVTTLIVAAFMHALFHGSIEVSVLPFDLVFWTVFILVLAAGFICFRFLGYHLVRLTRTTWV